MKQESYTRSRYLALTYEILDAIDEKNMKKLIELKKVRELYHESKLPIFQSRPFEQQKTLLSMQEAMLRLLINGTHPPASSPKATKRIVG